MTIYIDPTEARSTTRLPDDVIQRAKPLPGLEERTGADILISQLNLPAGSDMLLKRHTEAGLLVQRKSGQDLSNSITDGRLSRSLIKMREWTPRPWLVVCASLSRVGNKATLDGRPGLGYQAVIGALDWWQLRGGYSTLLSDDGALLGWLGQWHDRLKVLTEEPEKTIVTRQPQQILTEDRQRAFLMTLPGVGEERAGAILRAGGSPLSGLLCLLNGLEYIQGVGPETRASARHWVGMQEGEALLRIPMGWLDRMTAFLLGLQETEYKPAAVRAYADLMIACSLPSNDPGGWEAWAEKELAEPSPGSSDSDGNRPAEGLPPL